MEVVLEHENKPSFFQIFDFSRLYKQWEVGIKH